MAFLNFGYYIVSPATKPDYIQLECAKILTVSGCICDHHPSLEGCFWANHKKEQKEYQEQLMLSDQEFDEMKERGGTTWITKSWSRDYWTEKKRRYFTVIYIIKIQAYMKRQFRIGSLS